MTALDDKFVPLAKRLLDEKGATAYAVIEGASVYDPTTREYTDVPPSEVEIKVTPPYPARHFLQGAEVTEERHLVSFFAASGLTFDPVKVRWALKIDNVIYDNMEVNPIRSGDEIALYELELRR